jgi:PIN domain nuclease of toxin-antitoxin system
MTVLDTQTWVWWVQGDSLLPPRLRGYLEVNEKHGFGVSAMSCLEVARLVAAGRLVLPLPIDEWMDRALRYPAMNLIELSPQIAIDSTRLPLPFHKDPADRAIVATAIRLDAELATTDGKIRAYPHVRTVDF